MFGGEDISDFSVIKFVEASKRKKNLRKVGVGHDVLSTRSPEKNIKIGIFQFSAFNIKIFL